MDEMSLLAGIQGRSPDLMGLTGERTDPEGDEARFMRQLTCHMSVIVCHHAMRQRQTGVAAMDRASP